MPSSRPTRQPATARDAQPLRLLPARGIRRPWLAPVLALLSALPSLALSAAEAPDSYLQELDEAFYLVAIDEPLREEVRDFMLPLGAIEKIRGVWSPRESERISGERVAHTWRVEVGFTSAEIVDELDARLAGDSGARLLFSCEARACGSSVQWANRIFRERLLYGTEASQRYRVYGLDRDDGQYRLLIYASARSSDRQYLRAELIELLPEAQ